MKRKIILPMITYVKVGRDVKAWYKLLSSKSESISEGSSERNTASSVKTADLHVRVRTAKK